jgi:hypothetical protein
MRALFVWCFVLFASVAHAQNPCAAAIGTVTYNPSAAYVQIANFTATLPGSTTFEFDKVVVADFTPGADPTTATPLLSRTLDRTAFTLVTGTTDCYQATLASQPSAAIRESHARKVRTTTAPETGPWSPASNPFAWLAALTAPGAIRVGP